ncbi:Receptor-type tyrosine-protein phosphatase N2 [Chelonia mydas]|uniref:Receptor-type tyrosine-protein phosphatase N2 n=1 Tax=Chelonia mydas TaxID=8469 RepID=M7C924_CHEMY|nr:Receptor-type tyrosine-protein phosphatase N2 [Chelonia mydas]
MAVKSSDRPEPLHTSRVNSVSSQFSDGPIASPSARSSTSSWCEEPVQSNMDISTGHMILVGLQEAFEGENDGDLAGQLRKSIPSIELTRGKAVAYPEHIPLLEY